MKTALLWLALTLPLAACSAGTTSDTDDIVHPFVGCWDSADGLSREGWTIDPSGWLIGYAATRDADGKVTFFEHMRIERGGGKEVLFVTGGEDGKTVPFTRQKTNNPSVYHFTNPEHDYPQAISYRPDGNRLDAEISLLDGSNVVEFPKRACKP